MVLKEKYFKNVNILRKPQEKYFHGYPCKNFTKYFCVFFRFRTFCIFFSFYRPKHIYFGCGQGVDPPPPPFTDQSATNSFFTPSLIAGQTDQGLIEEDVYFYYEKGGSSDPKPSYRILHAPVRMKIQDCLVGTASSNNITMHSNKPTSNISIRNKIVVATLDRIITPI